MNAKDEATQAMAATMAAEVMDSLDEVNNLLLDLIATNAMRCAERLLPQYMSHELLAVLDWLKLVENETTFGSQSTPLTEEGRMVVRLLTHQMTSLRERYLAKI